jgi:hypothetical protein
MTMRLKKVEKTTDTQRAVWRKRGSGSPESLCGFARQQNLGTGFAVFFIHIKIFACYFKNKLYLCISYK